MKKRTPLFFLLLAMTPMLCGCSSGKGNKNDNCGSTCKVGGTQVDVLETKSYFEN